MPLTPEQQALREVAKAATPGPWHISEPSEQLHPVRAKDCIVADVGFSGSLDKDAKNAAYLAAANPAAILALLALLEAQDAERDKLLAIIASAYQIAGAHDAPAHILDVLADPEAATVEQVEAMLPYQAGRDVPDWQLQKVREALETYYRALTIKQPSAAQPAAIYAIEQAMGMSWMGWLASLPVGAAPAGQDERKE